MLRHVQKIPQFVLIILLLSLMTSCLSNKHLLYFPSLKDTTLNIVNNNFTPKIQKGDILLIAVNSMDSKSSELFSSANSVTAPGTVTSGSTAIPGFLVERDGTISFPKLGVLKVVGKTKKELSIEITDSLRNYLKDPIVNIRFMNYRVSVLGEVTHPGTFTSPNDRMNILEALALSGDLTVYANRENILIFRDSSNTTVTRRINISNNSIFNSPYYYLQSNDVIYVEPLKQKGFASSQAVVYIPLITAFLGILSTTIVLVSYFQK